MSGDPLEDMRELGAESPAHLEARVGRALLERLLEERLLVVLDATPAGPLVILGPAGRARFGLGRYYRTTPERAADQFRRRRCLDALRSRGWRYLGREASRHNLLKLEDPRGRRVYLLARWRQPPARSVSRILNIMEGRLQEEDAVLLVHADRPASYAALVRHAHGLLRLVCFRPGCPDGS